MIPRPTRPDPGVTERRGKTPPPPPSDYYEAKPLYLVTARHARVSHLSASKLTPAAWRQAETLCGKTGRWSTTRPRGNAICLQCTAVFDVQPLPAEVAIGPDGDVRDHHRETL